MSRIFAFLTVVFLTVGSAQAQTFFEMSEDRAQVPGEGTGGFGASLMFDWQAKFNLGQLMREPVISMQFRYRVLGGVVTLPTHDPEAKDGFQTEKLDGLPLEAQGLPELYDVKIRMYFIGKNGTKGMRLVDVGAPRKEGNWSFNVPSSPSWDKLFRSWNDDGWLSAERAKAMLGSGLMLDRYELDRAHLSLFDLHMWYEKNNPREWLRAYQNANARVAQGIGVSYGYPSIVSEDAFDVKPEALSLREALKALESARKQYGRLIKIPRHLKIGDNHSPYQQSLKDAQLMLLMAGRTLPKVTTGQLNVANARQAGFAPELDPGSEKTTLRSEPEPLAEADRPQCAVKLEVKCGRGPSFTAFPDQKIDFYPCEKRSRGKSARLYRGEWFQTGRSRIPGDAPVLDVFEGYLRNFQKAASSTVATCAERDIVRHISISGEGSDFSDNRQKALSKDNIRVVDGYRLK